MYSSTHSRAGRGLCGLMCRIPRDTPVQNSPHIHSLPCFCHWGHAYCPVCLNLKLCPSPCSALICNCLCCPGSVLYWIWLILWFVCMHRMQEKWALRAGSGTGRAWGGWGYSTRCWACWQRVGVDAGVVGTRAVRKGGPRKTHCTMLFPSLCFQETRVRSYVPLW